MTLLSANYKKGFFFVSILIASSILFTASAQTGTSNSRIAVVTNETRTNIWVSDFPKHTTVVISDTDDNLLSLVSTNDFGAAYVSLPTNVKNTIIVKTLSGEITVSNKPLNKNKQEASVATATSKDVDKA